MASISWRLAFPKAVISHRGAIKSDHTLIFLDINPSDSFTHRPFRFKAFWIRDERCKNVIENAWNANVAGSDFTKLYKKQASTRDALHKRNKEVFGHYQDRTNNLLKKIKKVHGKQPSRENELVEDALQMEFSEWLLRSKVIWRQKSRELWLKLVDKNSKFFYLSTIIRRRNNNINAIKKRGRCLNP